MNLDDLTSCTALLRGITDQLWIAKCPPKFDEGVDSMIQRVRAASNWATEILRPALEAQYPGTRWSNSEHRTADQQSPEYSDPYWIYDPIDGAYHYLQGLPMWSASLALVSGGKTVAAFVYDPSQKEMFCASAGKGAFMNDTHLRPSSKTDLSKTVVGTAFAPFQGRDDDGAERAFKAIGRISKDVFVIRMMAAASLNLAYVAGGRLDAYWEFGDDAYDWLAGALIVKEAGGIVSDSRNKLFDWGADGILATASQLHPAFATLVNAPEA